MNITPESVMGMTPQEKKIYFRHMERRNVEESLKVFAEKNARRAYKGMLIEDILKRASDRFTYEELNQKSVSTLERIYDWC